MKTLIISKKGYRNSLILCFLTVFFTNSFVIFFLPRPIVDYEVYYGGNYLLYSLLNLTMFMSFVLGLIILGLLIAERILMDRGYYAILQEEIKGKKDR